MDLVGGVPMICKRIFRLEKIKFYYYDKAEKENVEDLYVLGYFSSREELDKAMLICKQYGIDGGELSVQEFLVELAENQKFIYELSYEYSVLNADGQYVDYSYVFPPQRSRGRCLRLKTELQKQKKYRPESRKIVDITTDDGFWTEKCCLNKLYNVVTIS